LQPKKILSKHSEPEWQISGLKSFSCGVRINKFITIEDLRRTGQAGKILK